MYECGDERPRVAISGDTLFFYQMMIVCCFVTPVIDEGMFTNIFYTPDMARMMVNTAFIWDAQYFGNYPLVMTNIAMV